MIVFTVAGQPFGNQRVGENRQTKSKFLPKKSRDYQDLIAWNLKKAVGGHFEPSAQPFALMVLAFYEVPKSWPSWKREAALCGYIVPTTKPDVDNVCKGVMDAMNSLAYCDDAQVVNLNGFIKRYAKTPRLEISIDVLPLLPANCTRQDWQNHQSRQVDILA